MTRCLTSVGHLLTPAPRIDFDDHAAWVAERIEPGDHLVGHSYGGVIALLTAAAVGERVDSLTVIEPPCTSVALGDPAVAAFAAGGARFWRDGPLTTPRHSCAAFLDSVGSNFDPPSPLPHALERGARALIAERGPWEAEIPLERLRAIDLPTLVVSGAHHPAFDAICDALERELGAERLIVEGHGHNPQLDPRLHQRAARLRRRGPSEARCLASARHLLYSAAARAARRRRCARRAARAASPPPRPAWRASSCSRPCRPRGSPRSAARRRPGSSRQALAEVERLLSLGAKGRETTGQAVDVELDDRLRLAQVLEADIAERHLRDSLRATPPRRVPRSSRRAAPARRGRRSRSVRHDGRRSPRSPPRRRPARRCARSSAREPLPPRATRASRARVGPRPSRPPRPSHARRRRRTRRPACPARARRASRRRLE